jgi:hypothetical protein
VENGRRRRLTKNVFAGGVISDLPPAEVKVRPNGLREVYLQVGCLGRTFVSAISAKSLVTTAVFLLFLSRFRKRQRVFGIIIIIGAERYFYYFFLQSQTKKERRSALFYFLLSTFH